MANFCLICLNKLKETNDPESEYIMTDELMICDGCSKFRKTVIAKKKDFPRLCRAIEQMKEKKRQYY